MRCKEYIHTGMDMGDIFNIYSEDSPTLTVIQNILHTFTIIGAEVISY